MYRDLGPLAFFTGTTFIFVAIVYLLAFAIFSGWIASEKGRSFGAWFVLGLLFGPIALIAVGFAPDLSTGHQIDDIRDGLMFLVKQERDAIDEKLEKAKREAQEARDRVIAAEKAEMAARFKTKEDLLSDYDIKASVNQIRRTHGDSAAESYLDRKMKEFGITE